LSLKVESFASSTLEPSLSGQFSTTKTQPNLQACQIGYTIVMLQNHYHLLLREYFCEFGNLDSLYSMMIKESSDFNG
jgi:hypothetical protein